MKVVGMQVHGTALAARKPRPGMRGLAVTLHVNRPWPVTAREVRAFAKLANELLTPPPPTAKRRRR